MKLKDILGNKHNELLVKSYNTDLSTNDYIDAYIEVIESWLNRYKDLEMRNDYLIKFMISDLR